jgi:hypothetical protein
MALVFVALPVTCRRAAWRNPEKVDVAAEFVTSNDEVVAFVAVN